MISVQICIIIDIKWKKGDFYTEFQKWKFIFFFSVFSSFFLVKSVKTETKSLISTEFAGRFFPPGSHRKISYNKNPEENFPFCSNKFTPKEPSWESNIKKWQISCGMKLSQNIYAGTSFRQTSWWGVIMSAIRRCVRRSPFCLQKIWSKIRGSGTYLSEQALSPARVLSVGPKDSF